MILSRMSNARIGRALPIEQAATALDGRKIDNCVYEPRIEGPRPCYGIAWIQGVTAAATAND